MHGVLNVLKPPGMTSHDVVAFARRTLQTKKIGHTGTLDPAAAGVLPVCVGQATRLVEYLQAGTKEYIAEATFGFETDTGDAVGSIVAESDASQLDLEAVRAALDNFRGLISQTPPIYSAIKKDGQKLYDLARAGKDESEIEIPTRDVEISKLVITQFFPHATHPRAMLHIECSGGTYIRSLVRDIGRALGTHATMTFLVRTRSSGFEMSEAQTLEAIEQEKEKLLLPIPSVLGWCMPRCLIDDDAIEAFIKGQKAPLDCSGSDRSDLQEYIKDVEAFKLNRTKVQQSGAKTLRPLVAVLNQTRTTAAIATPIQGEVSLFKPEKVLNLAES